ncbi:hypothetical protein LVB87_09465 [Lysobacter sp. KIS68-7]|uniref:hypothetical protein n=1 Tax=Lysobacter sp. KIS68-7 TaxID=2904252 RepID=UPI001E39E2C8|nr:hypothetical protein [Lysobacter sp. KIS68-7]UHQ18442.1 hypothetical protein LVB87_09465 [Lysobacter sp. KIS68-7]
MPAPIRTCFVLACLAWSTTALAQDDVIRNDENLTESRPEAWAMRYYTGTTLMTPFGTEPALAPWQMQVGAELGSVPRLDDTQRRVGFDGIKLEDLNKSPVVGRLRGWIGLPWGFVAELGIVPPVSLNGTKPRDLYSAAIGRRLIDSNGFIVSARVVGQHGAAVGDITCPADIAGVQDPVRNPFGCDARSSDTLWMNYYGFDGTAALVTGAWTWHGTVGLVRMENEVQVNALTYGLPDRSRLVAQHDQPYLAAGVGRDFGHGWHAAAEVLYVPLTVLRVPDGSSDNDSLVSFRLQLAYRFAHD